MDLESTDIPMCCPDKQIQPESRSGTGNDQRRLPDSFATDSVSKMNVMQSDMDTGEDKAPCRRAEMQGPRPRQPVSPDKGHRIAAHTEAAEAAED